MPDPLPADAEPVLDTRGDHCPLPLLKLRRTASRLEGGTLLILSTDPLAPLDFEAWCLREGHRYEALADGEAHQRTRIHLRIPTLQ